MYYSYGKLMFIGDLTFKIDLKMFEICLPMT